MRQRERGGEREKREERKREREDRREKRREREEGLFWALPQIVHVHY